MSERSTPRGREVRLRKRTRILQSFRPPGDTSNPYIVQLSEALRTVGFDVRYFSWREAFFGSFDLFHVHWPEALYARPTRVRTAGSLILFMVLLGVLRVRRIPVVRTMHNRAPHDVQGVVHRFAYALLARSTARTIVLDEAHKFETASAVVIPHAHYIDWVSSIRKYEPRRGQTLFFGLLRPYKNVEALIDAFGALTISNVRLRIVGLPSTPDYGDLLSRLAAPSPNIEMELRYLDDVDLVAEITKAELVVLPYSEMFNSGALIMALSLGRRVLVPASPLSRSLASEVGEHWVVLYTGEITAETISTVLGVAKSDELSGPNLTGRSWDESARKHAALYDDVLSSQCGPRDRTRI
jgi:beta-1,4-mannosyltransferase